MRRLTVALVAAIAFLGACGSSDGATQEGELQRRYTPTSTQRVCAEWTQKQYGIDGYEPGVKCSRWKYTR